MTLDQIRNDIQVICIPSGFECLPPGVVGEDGVQNKGLSYTIMSGKKTKLFLFSMYKMHRFCQINQGSLKFNMFPMFCSNGKPAYIKIDMTIAVSLIYNCVIVPTNNLPMNQRITWTVCKCLFNIITVSNAVFFLSLYL